MSIGRVTQTMMSQQALTGLQSGLRRVSDVQEQLTTGRIINRPSDDPIGAAAAMKLRASLAAQQQYARNASDGLGWLEQIDGVLSSVTDQVRRGRELALQGANSGALGDQARQALAVEVEQVRAGLVGAANATYQGRPVFAGIAHVDQAYDATGAWQGQAGDVVRQVADGVTVRVDLTGPEAFGLDGDSVFDHLADLATALRAGDGAGISRAIDLLGTDGDRINSAHADVGTRSGRIDKAKVAAEDAHLTLTSSLSEIENTDLPKATVDLQLQQVAYQAALAATARVIQPSLQDFLR
jgi:flagellar hook-associated protein 3 FlgL